MNGLRTAVGAADGPGDGTCGVCGKVVALDRYVCPQCVAEGREALRAFVSHRGGRSLLAELRIVSTRQARMTRPDDTSRPTERPLPFNERAAAVLDDDRAWLNVAAAALHLPAANTPPETAALIAQHLPKHAGRPACVMVVAEAKRRVARAETLVDRPPAEWFAGHCDCGNDLYAREGAAAVECRMCGRVHDVEARRAYLLSLVEDQLATVAEICRAVHLFDEPVSRSQVTNWASRGQLVKRGSNRKGHATYRIGDVLNLLATTGRKPRRRA